MNNVQDILEAIRIKNINKIDEFIATGFNFNVTLGGSAPLLMAVVDSGDENLVAKVIEAGAYVDMVDKHGWTAFHFAISEGKNLTMLDVLLDHGADVNFRDLTGGSPLLKVAMRGNDATEYGGFNPLILASYLLKHGAKANSVDNNGVSVLSWAVINSPVECVRLLLEHQADPNSADRDGWTPIHRAAREGLREVISLLYSYGANPNLKTIDGRTPMDIAADLGHGLAELELQRLMD